MDNIIELSNKFDFSKLNLENPIPLQGGNFFTKLNFSEKQLPLLVQLPKCTTKHGIIKTQSSKKMYTDLVFNYFDNDILTWFENLEIRCRELIFDKKDLWFQTEMDLDDIETMFISPTKSYKSGKLITIRTFIPSTKNIKKDYCLIYDENEINLEASAINETTKIIPLINIECIRFSSKSFQLDINLRQVMVLSIEDEIKKDCLIKRNCESLNKEKGEDNNLESKALETIETKKSNLETTELKNNILEIPEKTAPIKARENNKININVSEIQLKKENSKEKPEEKLEENFEENFEEKSEIIGTVGKETTNELIDIKNDLCEVQLTTDNIEENVSLKKPNEVYLEIYKSAREKAKHMKQAAVEAYLEARNIKTKYMLNELNNSDDDFSI